MTDELSRPGSRVPADSLAAVLAYTRVPTVMTPEVETVHVGDTVAAVAARFRSKGHGAYPVLDDDGRCVGIVARGDLLRAGWSDDQVLGEVATGEVVAVRPDDLGIEALHR